MNIAPWSPVPYEAWSATRDTLHAHTQVLGKLAVALAPRMGRPHLLAAIPLSAGERLVLRSLGRGAPAATARGQ